MKFSCTHKARKEIANFQPISENSYENEFINWYLDKIVFKRKKYLLLTNSSSLYTLFVKAGTSQEKKSIVCSFKEILKSELQNFEIDSNKIQRQIEKDFAVNEFGKTQNRRILGTMVDHKKTIEYSIKYHDPTLELNEIRERLNRTPMTYEGRFIFPIEKFQKELEIHFKNASHNNM